MNVTRIAIRRPVTVCMFVVAVILFGVVSLDRLALNLLPKISYPSLTIQTDFEDAAPQEVESLVTRPLEESVGVVSGLTRMTSISRSGQSEVLLEFSWDTQMDLASMDVREKLDMIDLPRDVGKPVILRFDPSYDPVMRVQLYGDISLIRMRYVAERELEKGLEATDGVAAVKVVGGRQEQIRIEIDEKRLADLNIPITQVTNVIEEANLNRAGGDLYDLDANYVVRMLNEFRSVDEIQGIIIRDQDGRKILLGDIAHVWRGTKEREIIARLNGKESVELAIYKEGDANAVAVSEGVRAKLRVLTTNKTFPSGVEYRIVFDQATFIERSVNNVLMAAVLGGLLAMGVLFVFLRDVRSTVIIGLSIPISVMATFALMYQTGITLNIMSLGGVALGVGMLVDNSIVVLESVHRHRKSDSNLAEVVYQGTSEVGRAVSASTLTTLAVFVPLIFVEGIAGQLFKDQALAITYSLTASLLVAVTLIPMVLAVRFNREGIEDSGESEVNPPQLGTQTVRGPLAVLVLGLRRAGEVLLRFLFVDLIQVVLADLRRVYRVAAAGLMRIILPGLNLFTSGFSLLDRHYPRALTWSLDNKHLVMVLTAVVVLIAASVYQRLGAELIPPLAQGEFSFEIRLPEGRPLERTNRVIREIETRVNAMPQVENVFVSVGGSNQNQFAKRAPEEHVGQLHVVMRDRRDKRVELETIDEIREELGGYPDVSYTLSRPTLFSFKTPIEVEIYAFDPEVQRRISDLVAARLRRVDGLTDVQTTIQLGNPEIQIRFDRERLARLGLDEGQVANILRNKVRGDVASRYRQEDKLIDILVRAEESDRNSIADIRNLIINVDNQNRGGSTSSASTSVSQGQPGDEERPGDSLEGRQGAGLSVVPIRLGAVARVASARGPSEIHRIRSQRAAVVYANLSGRDLNTVSREIRATLQELRSQVPVNTVLDLGGQNEEMEHAYGSLLFALGLAVFLVYVVMASQFESFAHPFIILFTVPLAMVGVILSLYLTASNLSVMVFLGVIILAGIVVNNAIVLIDYTNQLRQQGLRRRDALLRAGQVRLRPIVMTTLTTVLGLFPMALRWGEGAEVRAPMAIAVMGGLLFSTILTLLLIPVVYELVDRKTYVVTDVSAVEAEY